MSFVVKILQIQRSDLFRRAFTGDFTIAQPDHTITQIKHCSSVVRHENYRTSLHEVS